MSHVDQEGPMGWWIHERDSIFKTKLEEERILSKLQDSNPDRFCAQAPREADQGLVELCQKYGKDKQGVDKGWSMHWLEDLAGVDIDNTPRQLIGSCVATSHIMLLATRSLHEIVILGEQEKLLGDQIVGEDTIMPFGPFSYRVGRAAAGINGGGDGSTCGGQIKGTMERGFLACDSGVESDRYPEPTSTSLYRRWGANNNLASKWYEEAQKLDLTESVRVRTPDDVWKSIVDEFKPIQICSGWGFRSAGKRLSNGWTVYRRSGSWSHSMQLTAALEIDGDRYCIVRNQWGKNAHTDGNWFVISFDTLGSWLRSATAMTIGNLAQREPDSFDPFPGF